MELIKESKPKGFYELFLIDGKRILISSGMYHYIRLRLEHQQREMIKLDSYYKPDNAYWQLEKESISMPNTSIIYWIKY